VGYGQKGGAKDAKLEKGSAAEGFAKQFAMFSKGTHCPLLCFFLRKHAPLTQNVVLLPLRSPKNQGKF
jgi:hypothetical protein